MSRRALDLSERHTVVDEIAIDPAQSPRQR
jgi:hypothetical protein